MKTKSFWAMLAFAPALAYAPADDLAGGGASGDGAAAAGGDAAAEAAALAAQSAASEAAGGAKAAWYEDKERFGEEDQKWLKAKGLNLDDPLEALPKLLRGHRSAEAHIGRGVDKILDRPADGQAYSEWARANAAALGLPEAADGYKIAPPESWPKDAPWDADFEKQFREAAFSEGISPAAAQKLTDIYAGKMAQMVDDAERGYEEANTKMMAELERTHGEQVPAVLARAKQGAQAIAEKAGLDSQAVEAITTRLAKDTGDAQVIQFMAAIGEMLGEDTGLGLDPSGGGKLGATRADAEAALADFMRADGEWYKASATRDNAAIQRLKPQYDALVGQVAKFSGK